MQQTHLITQMQTRELDRHTRGALANEGHTQGRGDAEEGPIFSFSTTFIMRSSLNSGSGASSTGFARHSIVVSGMRRACFSDSTIPAWMRCVSCTRLSGLPSLYFPAVTLPPQPVK